MHGTKSTEIEADSNERRAWIRAMGLYPLQRARNVDSKWLNCLSAVEQFTRSDGTLHEFVECNSKRFVRTELHPPALPAKTGEKDSRDIWQWKRRHNHQTELNWVASEIISAAWVLDRTHWKQHDLSGCKSTPGGVRHALRLLARIHDSHAYEFDSAIEGKNEVWGDRGRWLLKLSWI